MTQMIATVEVVLWDKGSIWARVVQVKQPAGDPVTRFDLMVFIRAHRTDINVQRFISLFMVNIR